MTNNQLKDIEKRFSDFAKSFFGDDDFVNSNLNLKLCHSYNVQKESEFIAKTLKLSAEQTNLAEAVGLLHDIGRFPQFVKYRTYTDHRSTNHCQLGADVIIEKGVIADLSQSEQDIIITAVKYHGVKQIPDDITGQALLQTQIVRDADKIDIYKVILNIFEQYRKDPKNFQFELEYPENGEYSDSVLDSLMRNERMDYRQIKTMNDARLLEIAWVFDINFVASLKRIQQKGYIDQMFDLCPSDRPFQAAQKHIHDYIIYNM